MTTAASSITPAAWRILGIFTFWSFCSRNCSWGFGPTGKNYWFIRLAGLSGASAVALAAYGRHALKNEDKEIRGIYESANQMHLIHSVVLLAVPLAKRPVIVSSSCQWGCSKRNAMLLFWILTDGIVVCGWNRTVQWNLLLQGNQEVARTGCDINTYESGPLWWHLPDSRLAESGFVNELNFHMIFSPFLKRLIRDARLVTLIWAFAVNEARFIDNFHDGIYFA